MANMAAHFACKDQSYLYTDCKVQARIIVIISMFKLHDEASLLNRHCWCSQG